MTQKAESRRMPDQDSVCLPHMNVALDAEKSDGCTNL